MPAAPRKATVPRKAAAPKVTPAEAAALEAFDPDDREITFRGQQFVIAGETRRSWRFAMAVASNSPAQMIFEMISPKDHPRLLTLGKPGEPFGDVAVDFFAAYNEASGQGNS